MNKKPILVLTLAVIALSSCNTIRMKSADSQKITKTAIYQTSKVADYDVKTEKVQGFSSNIYKKNRHNYFLNLTKTLALADAIEKGKCDFLVHPLYDITISGNKIEVKVDGYPATYTSFRTIEESDTISTYQVIIGDNAPAIESGPQKKKGIIPSIFRIIF